MANKAVHRTPVTFTLLPLSEPVEAETGQLDEAMILNGWAVAAHQPVRGRGTHRERERAGSLERTVPSTCGLAAR